MLWGHAAFVPLRPPRPFALDQDSVPCSPYRKRVRWIVFLLVLAAGGAAAQYGAPARQVLALAPELEAFAGSRANLESLAAGLHGGTAVTLAGITPDGMREIVSFTAARALPAEEIARVLDNARHHLLERGVSAPGGWDIALVLMGHLDIAPGGPVRQPGLLAPADPERPLVISLRPFAGSPANYRSLMRGLTQGRRLTLADPADPRSRMSFTPQCALEEREAREALLEAAELLAGRGRGDPAIGELRTALVQVLESKCHARAS